MNVTRPKRKFILSLTLALSYSLLCFNILFYQDQDESPLYRYYPNPRKNILYEDSIVEMTIYSGRGGVISSNYTGTGHSWLMIKNISETPLVFGHWTLEIEEAMTFSTWGLVRDNPHLGLWYNLETYRLNNTIDYWDNISYSEFWNQAQLDKLNNILLDWDATTWKLYENCTNFCVTTWNNVSTLTRFTEGYSYMTPWKNPTLLYRYLKTFPGHRVNYDMPDVEDEKVGYFDKYMTFNNDVGKVANGVGSSYIASSYE